MSRLIFRIDTIAMQTIWSVLLMSVSAHGANLTVKSGGGGNYTTIQACASAMAPGDTCTVYAGTYNEKVNVPAGTAGNYKTITVNGSDVVTVQSFTLHSHTKLIGNCPTAPSAINTCGFNIQNPSSPNGATCAGFPSGTTDVYIQNNVMYACGSGAMVGHSSNQSTSSYIFIQGNTMAYACITQAQAGTATKECDGLLAGGDHWLVENNDMSHYTLGMYFNGLSYGIFRNNKIHDQYETEAGGNSHTDAFFAEPQGGSTQHNLIEGNRHYNGFGPDAKGILTQAESCAGNCFGVIFRYNTVYDLDGRSANNDCALHTDVIPCFAHVKFYNNTYSNIGRTAGSRYDGNVTATNNSNNAADLNNIYYLGFVVTTAGFANPVGFDSTTAPSGVWGHNLAYCDASGASNCALFGKVYEQGAWLDGPGNILGRQDTVPTNNPNFVNLTGKDFRLQSSSPAIGKGTYLTTVSSYSGGTSLTVADAYFFQDGYGLQNPNSTVTGDCIAVNTASNHVCITAINYGTNTLTLSGPLPSGATAGQGVYLYSKSDGVQVLTGVAPDMGAYPSGFTGAPASPANPLAVPH